MDETQVGVTPVFMSVIVRRALDLGIQRGLGIVIEPEHASVHRFTYFQNTDLTGFCESNPTRGNLRKPVRSQRLDFRDPEFEPVIVFAQGELQARLQVFQVITWEAGQGFCRALILDVPKDSRAEGFQPGGDL
jgi:hypothetical protein